MAERGITACIPPTPRRHAALVYDKVRYRQRHKVEIMLVPIRDWRRTAMRHPFFSAVCIAAAVTFWLRYWILILVAFAIGDLVVEEPSAFVGYRWDAGPCRT